MNVRLQRAVREHELDQIAPLMPNGSHILEIGAGAGWQAKKLTEKGFDVTAIDLKDRSLAQHAVWGIEHYDGKIITFPDHHFDVVFTSNVLDHIPHVVEFQVEIKRVLKAEGMAIHVLPTTARRFWTIVTHYPHYVKQLVLLIAGNLLRKGPRKGGGPTATAHERNARSHQWIYIDNPLSTQTGRERQSSDRIVPLQPPS